MSKIFCVTFAPIAPIRRMSLDRTSPFGMYDGRRMGNRGAPSVAFDHPQPMLKLLLLAARLIPVDDVGDRHCVMP